MGLIQSNQSENLLLTTLKIQLYMIMETNNKGVRINGIPFRFHIDVKDGCFKILNNIKNDDKIIQIYYYDTIIYGIRHIGFMRDEIYTSKKIYNDGFGNWFLNEKTI